MKHSPTPWVVGYDGPSRPIITTAGHTMLSISQWWQGRGWVSYESEEDDAEFIVRAVNCHDELVAAVKSCLRDHEMDPKHGSKRWEALRQQGTKFADFDSLPPCDCDRCYLCRAALLAVIGDIDE